MNLNFPVLLGRDAGRNIFILQAFPEPIRIIASSCKKGLGGGESIQQFFSAFVIWCTATRLKSSL